MDIPNFEQGERLPAVYVSELAALISELPSEDKLSTSMTICIAVAGLNERYIDTRKEYFKGNINSFSSFQVLLQRGHDFEVGEHALNQSSAHIATLPRRKQRDPSKTCSHCGLVGHIKAGCWKKDLTSHEAKKLVEEHRKGPCTHCGVAGHTKTKCRKKHLSSADAKKLVEENQKK